VAGVVAGPGMPTLVVGGFSNEIRSRCTRRTTG
jgi:hypothetical protein